MRGPGRAYGCQVVFTKARQCAQELFEQVGPQVGADLEEIVPCLLRKAGEMSTAGRDNFLAQYADAALSQMVLSCSEAQCARALLTMCAH